MLAFPAFSPFPPASSARVIGAAIDIGCYEDDNIPMLYLLR